MTIDLFVKSLDNCRRLGPLTYWNGGVVIGDIAIGTKSFRDFFINLQKAILFGRREQIIIFTVKSLKVYCDAGWRQVYIRWFLFLQRRGVDDNDKLIFACVWLKKMRDFNALLFPAFVSRGYNSSKQ